MVEEPGAPTPVPCDDVDEAVAFLTARLGFRLELVAPADDPAVAVVAGHGVRLALRRRDGGLDDDTLRALLAGEVIVPPLVPSFALTRPDDGAWVVGRAGMRYRDLVPGRQGGHLVASHIHIPEGGEVADYVHYHHVRFQVIVCRRGWVRVVYEDQGPPFVLDAGDAVLQPPGIRHRVLACSPDLEVVEVGSPAVHATFRDHALALPTRSVRAERRWGGQAFVRHRAATSPWEPWRMPGFEAQDLGVGAATGGLADVRIARRTEQPRSGGGAAPWDAGAALAFVFVLDGTAILDDADGTHALEPGVAFTMPAARAHGLRDVSPDLALLEVLAPERAPGATAPR